METNKKRSWTKCRLVPHRDSGRIRWCIGEEHTWKSKLKFLAIIPIVLLTVVIISLIFTRFEASFRTKTETTIPSNYEDDTVNEEERDIQKYFRTSFLTTQNYLPIYQNRRVRRFEREVRFPLQNDTNIYENYSLALNESADEFNALNWQILQWLHALKTDGLNTLNMFHTPVNNQGNVKYFNNSTSKDATNSKNSLSLKLLDADMPVEEVRKIQAETMKKYMNDTVDPCTDFYSYACGNWEMYNPIPPDRVGFDTFEQLRATLDEVLKNLLEDSEPISLKDNFVDSKDGIATLWNNPYNDNNRGKNYNVTYLKKLDAITKVKLFYQSCMDEDILQNRREVPLLELLKKLGGWPAIAPDWDSSNFDFIGLLGSLRLYNNDILISEWIGPDINNSDEYIIQIDQTTLGLPSRDYFLDSTNSKYVQAYHTYILQIIQLLGAPLKSAIDDADDIVRFETMLAKIMADPDYRRNVSEIYNKMYLFELQSLIKEIDWQRYMNIIFEKPIDVTTPVVVYCVPFLEKLVKLLSVTPTRTVANYLLWRFVRHRANNLDKRFDEAKQRFYNIILGREKSPPRWQSCVSQANSNMGMALGSLFVKKYFDETSKNDTMMMTIELQQAFREILKETEWLDLETKKIAKDKIDAMRLRIGYPDFITNYELINKKYEDVEIHPQMYFENILSILRHLTKFEQSKVGSAVKKDVWNTAPAIVNAYYSRNKNQIMFPAGILQPPFYHRNFPKALNYGGIGVVIGHEITHGFDDKGRLFNHEGNLRNWWKDISVDQFHTRTQCLIKQYNSFTIPEINEKVDGINTQGENIADNGGIKQAFWAYKQWQEQNPMVDDTMPGLNLTKDQLFFLNFAQVWCGSIRPEAAKNKLKTAVHSPGRFRVTGTLTNSIDFANVFNCTIGTPMNPQDKCSIW